MDPLGLLELKCLNTIENLDNLICVSLAYIAILEIGLPKPIMHQLKLLELWSVRSEKRFGLFGRFLQRIFIFIRQELLFQVRQRLLEICSNLKLRMQTPRL